jgi:hypothetical protein
VTPVLLLLLLLVVIWSEMMSRMLLLLWLEVLTVVRAAVVVNLSGRAPTPTASTPVREVRRTTLTSTSARLMLTGIVGLVLSAIVVVASTSRIGCL